MEAAHVHFRALAALETVRCLKCSEVYAKPIAGGTTTENPGCPVCGYVGWVAVTVPATRPTPLRFAAGRLPRRPGLSR